MKALLTHAALATIGALSVNLAHATAFAYYGNPYKDYSTTLTDVRGECKVGTHTFITYLPGGTSTFGCWVNTKRNTVLLKYSGSGVMNELNTAELVLAGMHDDRPATHAEWTNALRDLAILDDAASKL
ncbi:hypothetical protein [Caballeronia grimmiae]|uniref:hypothetical protein n=1 Tax=Caballeronia grimmiae TaxID=1071679 RepID=UPI0038B80FB9